MSAFVWLDYSPDRALAAWSATRSTEGTERLNPSGARSAAVEHIRTARRSNTSSPRVCERVAFWAANEVMKLLNVSLTCPTTARPVQ